MRLSKNNRLIFDINDLPYEQAIDLGLPINNFNKIDKVLFSLSKAKFLFASREMMNYAKNKYKIKSEVSYLVNGGILSENIKNDTRNKVSFVYAGTLNIGRQIEEMLNVFKFINVDLYLMGTGGDWIKNISSNFDNIKYLGSLPEKEALEIVSRCDCGVIPYDDTKLYYNICFPTKASFYVCAGIPFISPPLRELTFHFNEDLVFFEKMHNWGDLINSCNFKKNLLEKKNNIVNIRDKFSWNSILEEKYDEFFGEISI